MYYVDHSPWDMLHLRSIVFVVVVVVVFLEGVHNW